MSLAQKKIGLCEYKQIPLTINHLNAEAKEGWKPVLVIPQELTGQPWAGYLLERELPCTVRIAADCKEGIVGDGGVCR